MNVNAHVARMLGVEGLVIGVIALFKSSVTAALLLLVGGACLLLFGCLRPESERD